MFFLNKPGKLHWKSLIFLILLIALAGYYFKNIFNFLSISKAVEPAILVVEGWLNEDALDYTREKVLRNDYKLIITTGFPYREGYMIGSGGKVIFDINGRITPNRDSSYLITLLIRGTKASNAFAHIKMYADTVQIGDNFTTRKKKYFPYAVKLENPPDSISIAFDNDMYTRFRDRNIYIYSVTINNQIFTFENTKVTYFTRKSGKYDFRGELSSNSAMDAAKYLINSGIADSLVVPVITTSKIKSKTYSTALDVNRWLALYRPGNLDPITVVSPGPHARRSWISYKKAFGDSIPVGVIACPDKQVSRDNWWKTFYGWRTILYETVGVLYATVVL